MKYRAEVDGLRALAVIPVILFHAGIGLFSGGFIGVDIFFVISGYLITTIILSEKKSGVFSLANFYERRARRILPALFLVMLATIPLAYLWFIPSDFKDFSQSLFAVTVSLSNFLFLSESGYFESATELKPLLHTWSLAVEEQYYLLFPLLLISMWKWKRSWMILVLVMLALASISLAQWASLNEPKAAFYLLPTRFWELLIGSFVAAYLLKREQVAESSFLSSVGLLLIVYSMLFFDNQTPFPSVYTLIPTLGAALVILFTTKESYTYVLLSNKVMVSIGLISYSAYLWHFPLISLAKYRMMGEVDNWVMAGLLGCTFMLAWLTWKYVETPTRDRRKFKRPLLIKFSIIGSLFFGGIGYYGHTNNGLENRGDFSKYYNKTQLNVGKRATKTVSAKYNNLRVRGGSPPSIALIGDSHTGRLFNQFEIKNPGVGFLAISGPHCAPIAEFKLLKGGGKGWCRDINNKVFDTILDSNEIETVILFAEWSNYTTGYRDNDRPSLVSYRDNTSGSVSDNIQVFKVAFLATIKNLKEAGKRVIIINSTPEFPVSVFDTYIKKNHFNEENVLINITVEKYNVRNQAVQSIFSGLDGVDFVDVKPLFCGKLYCQGVAPQGNILFSDTNHLTEKGAKIITDELWRLMN